MDFKLRTVNPNGRNKYGNYYSSSNLTQSITRTVFNGNGTTEDLGDDKKDSVDEEIDLGAYVVHLSHNYFAFNKNKLENSGDEGIVDEIYIKAYKKSTEAQAFIGVITGVTEPDPSYDPEGEDPEQTPWKPAHLHCDISGVTEGMELRVKKNGTLDATITIKYTKDLISSASTNLEGGELLIPVSVYMGKTEIEYNPSTDLGNITAWESNSDFCASCVLNYTWTIADVPNGKYVIDLSNETAFINCDHEGNILPGAARPKCHTNIYYGASTVIGGAVYSLVPFPEQLQVQGVSITNDGEIIFGSDFNFTGSDNLQVIVRVDIAGPVVIRKPDESEMEINEGSFYGTKTMNIYKNIPQEGEDAVTKWLLLSADQIIYDPNTETFLPTSIEASVMKQVGEKPIEIDTEETIWYGYDTTTPLTEYTGPVTPTKTEAANYHYIEFGLHNGKFYYELETCCIVKNGLDGEKGDKGEQGLIGPSVRGPREFNKIQAPERFCAGFIGNPSEYEQDDEKWIDIVLYDGQYYRCIKSHTYMGGPFSSYSSYWEVATNFNFVATELLLAENAKINFLTNNQLTLTYIENGVEKIAGGAQGGKNVVFWAGSEQPSPSPFEVYYDGSIKATKGQFGCLSIGNNQWNEATLEGYHNDSELGTCSIELDPNGVMFTSNYAEVAVAANIDRFDRNAPVDIQMTNPANRAIDTNGRIECGSLTVNNEPVVTCEEDIKIKIVTQMPANPDAKTLYIVIEV